MTQKPAAPPERQPTPAALDSSGLLADLPDGFPGLVRIFEILRSPEGCEWDRAQSHQSLRPYLIEEAYEVVEAIDSGDLAALREELGDLLLQIVFQSQIAREAGNFSIEDVIAGLKEKLIRRHPHVFGDLDAITPEQALRNWNAIKKDEKKKQRPAGPVSVLDGLPRGLPALIRAQRLGEKAGAVGFDWPAAADILRKLDEETNELKQTLPDGEHAASEEELGDMLFVMTQLARKLKIDGELALQRANEKFIRRFREMEQLALERHRREPLTLDLAEWDVLWEEVKQRQRERKG